MAFKDSMRMQTYISRDWVLRLVLQHTGIKDGNTLILMLLEDSSTLIPCSFIFQQDGTPVSYYKTASEKVSSRKFNGN